ncbi:hypothetical protein AB0J90_18040 [Micromonospora sp. NPDC049523]|uniref:hypothetical protein n=1 Tax=Micromonospora sp. NPDC049523 TaxID=3155921 RepID=UPI003433AC5F
MTETTPTLGTDTDTTQAAGWLRVVPMLAHRWPTWLGLAFAAINLADTGDGTEFSFLLLLAASGYLLVAVLDRPRVTWPVLYALVAAVVVLRLFDFDPWPVLAVVAVLVVAVGLVRGQLRRPGLYALQSPAALGFIALGLAALYVPADIGRYLVAAGLLAHAVWDGIHWRANKIVARSFAEWCGVLDLVVGLAILMLVH